MDEALLLEADRDARGVALAGGVAGRRDRVERPSGVDVERVGERELVQRFALRVGEELVAGP